MFSLSDEGKIRFSYFLEVDYQNIIILNIKSTLTILKNWLIDLLSRYHRTSVNEMVSQEGGSITLYCRNTRILG